MRRLGAAVLLGATVASAPSGTAGVAPAATPAVLPAPVPRDVRRALREATVLVLPARCGGVLIESRWLVATALHCIEREDRPRIRFDDGTERAARLEVADPDADQAVLRLDAAAEVAPLPLARRRPIVGTVLYFAGNPERPRLQDSRVDRIGRCESLPALEDALFTSIEGTPGDSGSPLVDGGGEVVGLVHGGARCHIATPASRLGRLVDAALGRAES